MKVWKSAAAIAAIMFCSSTPVSAQIKIGIGLAAPLTGRDIATNAHLEEGVVRVDKTLDASPQIFVEMHRAFKVGEKYAIGPMIGFAPKIDFGTASNTTTEQPLGAGFGMLVTTPAGKKHFLNFGIAWLITSPVTILDAAWRDGYQAPRSRGDFPMAPNYDKRSVNRVMLTMTVSGLFGGS